MAKKKKRSAADRYASQVSAESTLKFGPEADSLAAALADAEKSYGSDVAVAQGTRAAIQTASQRAKPEFRKDYGAALGTVDQTKATLSADLARLPGAGALAGAPARDAAGTRRRLAEALAANEAEMTSRSADAVSGERFAIAAAGARRADTREKVQARAQGLAREQGAFSQARSGELVESARGRSVTRRGQTLTAEGNAARRRTQNKNTDAQLEETKRHNRRQEQIQVEKGKEKGKPKAATPEKTQKVKTQISRAVAQAERMRAVGRGRHDAAGLLVNGLPGQQIKEAPKDGFKFGGQTYNAGDPLPNNGVKIPDVKPTEELYASVALDIAYDGHVSTRNMRLLQKMGLSVRELGLSTEGRSGTRGARKRPPSILPVPRAPERPNALTGRGQIGGLR
jgi:hypothetical protein